MYCERCKKIKGSSQNFPLPELLPFVSSGRSITVGGGHIKQYYALCKVCRPIVLAKMREKR